MEDFVTLRRSGYQWSVGLFRPNSGMGRYVYQGYWKNEARARVVARQMVEAEGVAAYADYTGDKLIWRA